MNELTPSPSRRLRAFSVAVQWVLWLLLGAWLLLGLAWGGLHGWIVPRIGEFRPMLEIQASKALGVPVRIGAISAQSTGMIPSFELRDVTLLDGAGRVALRLPRVLAALSPRSLLKLGFEQLYIDRPELDIRRTADGKILVGGLDFSSTTSHDTRALDWFFSQTEFVIHDGLLRWSDEQRGAPPLVLKQLDFVLRNKARSHAMRIDATPPPQWGERFHLAALLRQPLLARHSGQWQQWVGQVYADFARVDLAQLHSYADLPDLTVERGNGAVRAWADVSHGRFTGGTFDVALAEVAATLGPQLQPLVLQSVVGRFGGRLLAGGFNFSTQGLQFSTPDGLRWPGGNAQVTYTQAEGRVPAQGEVRADKLDLAALTQIADRIPLSPGAHAALAAYAPKGLVEQVQGSWQGLLEAPVKFSARGRVVQLEIAAQPAAAPPGPPAHVPVSAPVGTPGVRGATVDFDLTQSGGKARIAIQAGALSLPGVFEDPVVPLDQLGADVQWQVNGEQIATQLTNVKFSNADAQGDLQLSWKTSDPAHSPSHARFPGVLDLQGSLARAQATRVYRYLPLVLPASVRDYVRDAVLAGSASTVKFAVKGDLHDLPFADPKQGEFHVAANLQNTTFAFVPHSLQSAGEPPWPALTQLSATLVFDRQSLQIKGATGKFAGANGLPVTRADAQIADLTHAATVVVDAQTKGPLKDMLGFVAGSPLDAMTGQALSQASASGPADLKLHLELPIHSIAKSKVLGSVTLAGNDLQMSPGTPLLGKAQGVVSFTESGFAITGGQARMLGGDIRIEGGMRAPTAAQPDSPIVIRAQGSITALALQQARELGAVARLAQNATGSTTYAAVLGFRKGVPDLLVTSSLQGLALNLPAPLNKSADAALPLRLESKRLPGSTGQPQDQLSLDIGRIAFATYVRDLSGAQARVVRGAIGAGLTAGEAPSLPDAGVVASVNLERLDLDAWQALLSRAAAPGAGAVAPQAATPGATPADESDYLPTVVALRARELTVQGRTLHNVVVGGSRDGRTWRANLDADELDGYAEYRPSSGAGAGRVYARLARLKIAASSTSKVEELLEKPTDSVPALDIVVDDFELKGKRLGRVEIDAVNRGPAAVAREGGIREWRLNKLNITLPEATFSATGNWAAPDAQAATPGGLRRTTMNFKLDINDSGALLARFGMKDVIRRGKGTMQGQVAWTGSPFTLDYPTMGGQFNVNIEGGQFLKADPGLAKLLGVLSLQSLPRRLTLNFSDVFSDGFAFDFVRGDVKINHGIAATNNLQMKGVNAAVLMDGQADLAHETQSIRVVVVPELNAGTASLIATAINPAIGLGSFLAQYFLRRPLMEAATQEFHIDGTWTDPKITRVEHKTGVTQ
ncbi:YhdP family protein [Rhodoferax sediminis]|uniref:TIGR02099 family protein n=1 Tax=Rhodoferax sediminis TaxID=2509614 RepID=A0A515D6E8_9BURK|nr:TIGR02099 family protein [Rhodoferax sediminis]